MLRFISDLIAGQPILALFLAFVGPEGQPWHGFAARYRAVAGKAPRLG
jgi:hypothetical protein